jgi:hypothetical protein
MGVKSSVAFPIKPLFLSWLLVLISLSLILKSGLYSDDVITFQTRKSAGPISFIQVTNNAISEIKDCAQAGRFTPITYLLHCYLFWIVNTILAYKIIILFFNLLAVLSFTQMLRSFELDGWIPLVLILFCASAQFFVRYHDPFTSLHAMYPLLAVFIFSSISYFAQYLKNGKATILAGSVLMTVLATLQSEIGFVLYPVLMVLLSNDDRPISFKSKAFLPFIILLALNATLFLFLRRDSSHMYSGVQTNLDPAKMFDVAYFQLVSAIPMTGYAYMSNIGGFFAREFSKTYPFLILSIIVVISIIKSSNPDQYKKLDTLRRRDILGVGLILLVLPACILMMSKKYQGELDYGRGYLPVYIQDFGFVLLMLAFFDFLFVKFRNRKKTILTLGFSLVFLVGQLTFMRNDYLIGQMNSERSTPSDFLYKSLKNGILNSCEKGSVIVFGSNYFYPTPVYYQTIVDNFYNTHLRVILKEDFNGKNIKNDGAYYLLEHDNTGQFTTLYRLSSNEKKMVRRINYPIGDEFSYFDLISKPL